MVTEIQYTFTAGKPKNKQPPGFKLTTMSFTFSSRAPNNFSFKTTRPPQPLMANR